jgi:hypothetical protein
MAFLIDLKGWVLELVKSSKDDCGGADYALGRLEWRLVQVRILGMLVAL